jgi:hypothetical protein
LIHLTRLAYANADDWAERGFKTIDADLDEHGYLAGCEYIDELFKWHREKERRNESA